MFDFQSLARRPFDLEAYRAIPQFIYIGDRDTRNSQVYDWFLWPDAAVVERLDAAFGDTDPRRLAGQAAYLQRQGYDATFRLYPGAGHDYTRAMIGDLFAFLDRYREKQELPVIPISIRDQATGM